MKYFWSIARMIVIVTIASAVAAWCSSNTNDAVFIGFLAGVITTVIDLLMLRINKS